MPFDILLLIDQIKKFLKNEKGTLISLFAVLLIEFIIFNYIYLNTTKYVTLDFLQAYGLIALLTFIVWTIGRHISTSDRKTNIGISRFDIVNIDMKNVLNGELRYSIAEELDQYIYNRLMLDNRYFDVRKYLNLIILPPRFSVNRDNPYKYRKFRFLDFLVTGVMYYEDSKLSITPNFIFVYDLPTNLFQQIKDNLITDKKFGFVADGSTNLALDKLLHSITYIGLLYTCVKLAHKKEYKKSDELAQEVIDKLQKLYESDDQSVNFGDADFLKIEALLYFIKAKNYHKWGNHLLFDKNKSEEAKTKFDDAAKTLILRNDILKKLKEIDDNLVDNEILDHSYIYAIGLLAKEKNKELGKKLLENIKSEFKKEENEMYAEAIFAERLNEEEEALKKYQKVLETNPNNKFALRRIISLAYKNKDYKTVSNLSEQLLTITNKQVYDEHYFDTRVIQRYAISSLKTFHLINFVKNITLLLPYSILNYLQSRKKTNF